MTPPPPPLKRTLRPGQSIDQGRYRLVRKLGAGGNGVVWLAFHSAMNAEIVLKFPSTHTFTAEAAREQFELEIRSLVAFSNSHPHIVNILDVGRHLDRPFVAMQYLARGSLQGFVYGSEGFSHPDSQTLHRVPGWLANIADALDHVHERGLLHRDVKPGNILIDDSFAAYLADFGIAAAVGEHSASSAGIVGSLPYLAPEVLLGADASPRSDQFSLAVTTYEYLCGKQPFAADDSQQLADAHRRTAPPIDKHRRGLPAELWKAVRRALSVDPGQRFDCCRAFAGEVERWWCYSAPTEPGLPRPRPPLPQDETRRPVGTEPQQQVDSSAETADDAKDSEGEGNQTGTRNLTLSRLMRQQKRKN